MDRGAQSAAGTTRLREAVLTPVKATQTHDGVQATVRPTDSERLAQSHLFVAAAAHSIPANLHVPRFSESSRSLN